MFSVTLRLSRNLNLTTVQSNEKAALRVAWENVLTHSGEAVVALKKTIKSFFCLTFTRSKYFSELINATSQKEGVYEIV
jgi:hypothetical protein